MAFPADRVEPLDEVRVCEAVLRDTSGAVDRVSTINRAAALWRLGEALFRLERFEQSVDYLRNRDHLVEERAASDRFEHVRPASDELTALVLYADAAAQTSDRPVARILYGLVQPTADTAGDCGSFADWLTPVLARGD